MENNIRNRKEINRKKRRQKMRRRRIIFYIILLATLLLIIKIITAFVGAINNKDTKQSFNWFLDKAYRDSIGELRTTKPTYSNFNDRLNAIYDEFEFMKKELMPNTNHLVQADSYAYDTAEIRSYIRGEKEYKGKEKLVFLTFDDGPNYEITPQVINILKANQVHGTFFVVGNRVNENTSPVLHQIIYNGNSIGTHSFNHNYEELYPQKVANVDQIKEETLLTQSRLKKVFGESFQSDVWRYPGGHMSWQGTAASDAALSDIGAEWIDWNCMVGDAEPISNRPTTPAGMVEMVDKTLKKNLHTDVAVVLMHDAKNKQLTADSLQGVIDYFKDNGYTFGILK